MRAHVVVHGAVQGVFYRGAIRDAATRHGVAGFATNLDDGTVECIFEGSSVDVDAMLEAAREGSSGSSVESLDVEWLKPLGCSGFRIG